MTAPDRAALVERVAEAIRSRPHFASLDHARHLVDLIRNETLEEAARVAEGQYWRIIDISDNIAAAIRALKTSSGASGS